MTTISDDQVVVIEGGMGSMLQSQGMPEGYCPMQFNLDMPDVIIKIHQAYQEAGADVALSNTFGGTRAKLTDYGLQDHLSDINRAGVRLARCSGASLVFGDIGPCGMVLQPLGQATFDDAYSQYREQADALLLEQPDALLIETMVDIADARCAVIAAKDAVAASGYSRIPVFISCTFGSQGRMELSGTPPEVAAIILESVGADGVGINCGVGPELMAAWIRRMADATELPLFVQPNAGIPFLDEEGHTIFPGTPSEMSACSLDYLEAGAQFIGSCCGSTPEFTRAIVEAVAGKRVCPRPTCASQSVRLASPRSMVALGVHEPARIIGERINPTGKKDLAAELHAGSMSLVRRFAQEQLAGGADLLDVNVGTPDIDEANVLVQAVHVVQSLVDIPLVIDTVDACALEAALKAYPGRALINSVNGEKGSMDRVLPLAKRYGAAVLILALDEQGVPEDVPARLAIVQRVRESAHLMGLADSDLVIDMLTMAAATDAQAPDVTLEGTHTIAEWGLATVLGVSNVSHGLPQRSLLNAAFLSAALAGGLSGAIINPNISVVRDAVNIHNARTEPADYQTACADWHQAFAFASERAAACVREMAGDSSVATKRDEISIDPEQALRTAILCGDAQAVSALVDKVIEGGRTSTACVEEVLTPALNELGDAYNRGEAFLPQLITAGDAMKVAVARCKDYMAQDTADDGTGCIIFCTVKGDVHSIGKDICIALLESQGYVVADLGVDVDSLKVLEAARSQHAKCVCLSALMTTTLAAMKETVLLLQSELPGVPVMVGGAVVTEEWARSVGAGYSDNAIHCAEEVRAVLGS